MSFPLSIVLFATSIALERKAVQFRAANPAEMKSVAQRLAAEISPPLLVTLSGELGTGKTTLVREVLTAWGIAGANSPTFNLRNDYSRAGIRVIHLDFYRLKPGDAADDILPPDEDYTDAVVFAEWPEKMPIGLSYLFSRKAELKISGSGDDVREIDWRPA